MVAGFGFIDKIEEMVSFNEAKNKLCILATGTKELELAYRLSDKYKLSVTDCECIVIAKLKKAILLTDDSYLAKIAKKEGVERIFDLKSLIEACIIEGRIKQKSVLNGIIESLRQKDNYVFSDSNLKQLFSHFP